MAGGLNTQRTEVRVVKGARIGRRGTPSESQRKSHRDLDGVKG